MNIMSSALYGVDKESRICQEAYFNITRWQGLWTVYACGLIAAFRKAAEQFVHAPNSEICVTRESGGA